jgi:hypothetical protein
LRGAGRDDHPRRRQGRSRAHSRRADAYKIDEMVRQSPELAYDITFYEFACAAGWPGRLSLAREPRIARAEFDSPVYPRPRRRRAGNGQSARLLQERDESEAVADDDTLRAAGRVSPAITFPRPCVRGTCTLFYGDITSSGDCIDPLAERCGTES